MRELKAAGAHAAIDIIADGAATGADGFGEDLLCGAHNGGTLCFRQTRGALFRAHTGAKEDLVGVDVADPGDVALVEDVRLDGAFASACRSIEIGCVEILLQRLRPERRKRRQRADRCRSR